MRYARLEHETDDYRKHREELRLAEIELIEHRERVAEMRRALPLGPIVEDYLFLEGPTDLRAGDEPVAEVRLSDLFTGPDRALIIYHFMYGKQQTSPCPMCTLWIDGFNGVAHHLKQNADLAIAAAAPPAVLRAHARDRGWHRLRMVSCGDNTFKYDFGSEDEHGEQDSTISVFVRDGAGEVHHTYSARPQTAEDVHQRGLDALSALWNLLDLTPQGRDDWYASLDYGC
jgi:predicted dithiol-disulfide oxidoreductase (DUF899 family)